jgi:hypothetical protein
VTVTSNTSSLESKPTAVLTHGCSRFTYQPWKLPQPRARSRRATSHPTHGRVLEVRITAEGARLLERAKVAAKTVEDRAKLRVHLKQL